VGKHSLARVAVALAVVAVIAAACGGSTQQLGTAAPPAQSSAPAATSSSAPSADATTAPTSEATQSPDAGVTPEPATPEPTQAAAAEPVISARFFKVWTDSIQYLHYQAVIEVTNGTSAPVDINSGSQDFTIYAKDGTVLTTGSFLYAFPSKVAPAEKGYLVESGIFDQGTKAKNVGKFEESLSWSPASEATALFTSSKVKLTTESYGTSLQASAVVTNSTGADAADTICGFIFFDANGKILGALYDNTVDKVYAGKSKGVKTSYPGTPPVKPSAVKRTLVVAYDNGF